LPVKAAFRPVLGAQGLLTKRGPYRATHAATSSIDFFGLS
jgi:hypothetical protein